MIFPYSIIGKIIVLYIVTAVLKLIYPFDFLSYDTSNIWPLTPKIDRVTWAYLKIDIDFCKDDIFCWKSLVQLDRVNVTILLNLIRPNTYN